jgi:RND family efflux transporter MFP subunit
MCNLRISRQVSGLPLILLMATLFGPAQLGADEARIGKVVVEIKGYIVPASQVTVSPKVAGQVVDMRIEEGKQVKEGDVLARLDPAEHEAALQLARAELNLAEAGLAKAKEGASTADLTIAQAKVKVAQAQVVLAQYRLEGTVIRAPVSGTVLVKRAEVGTRIDPKASQVSASLCDLANLRTLDVEIWAPERDLAKVFPGQSCVIRMEAVPDATYKGHVVRLLPVADRAKGAVGIRVRVDVPAGDNRLRPELAAIVQFVAKP